MLIEISEKSLSKISDTGSMNYKEKVACVSVTAVGSTAVTGFGAFTGFMVGNVLGYLILNEDRVIKRLAIPSAISGAVITASALTAIFLAAWRNNEEFDESLEINKK